MDTSERVRFGAFEVDRRTGELRKYGIALKLQDQPAKVLAALLARPGEVVSREELERLLWPNGTFVDFEGGLNAAVNRLRRVLSDSAENPRYIATVARRGYRFIGTIESNIAGPGDSSGSPPGGFIGQKGIVSRPDSPALQVRVSARLRWLLATLVAITAAALTAWIFRTPQFTRTYHLALTAPPQTAFLSSGTNSGNSSLSPDGTMLAYSGRTNGKIQVWLRRLDTNESHVLSTTEEGYYPFWSPDSRWIGFFADGKLKTIPISGGPAHTVCDASIGRGGTWNSQGIILFSAATTNRTIMSVSSTGGTPREVTKLQGEQNAHYWPMFLPDGRHFLFTVRSANLQDNGIWVSQLDAAAGPKQLINTLSNAAYAPSSDHVLSKSIGFLLFLQGQSLIAQPFDPVRLALKGDPVALANKVGYAPNIALGDFSVSSDGSIVVYGSGIEQGLQLTWRDRTGRRIGIQGTPADYRTPRLSPDGKRLAVARGGSASDIWVRDLERGTEARLTVDPTIDMYPVWSPDSERIAYLSLASAPPGIMWKHATGTGEPQPLYRTPITAFPCDWSPDGKYLLLSQTNPTSQSDLMILDMNPKRKVMPFRASPFSDTQGRFSHDGRWIAYSSNVSGTNQIYVQRFAPGQPAPDAGWKVSTTGGNFPAWRGDDRELFYLSPEGKMMAATCRTKGNAISIETPVVLFETVSSAGLATAPFDVSADGQRFLLAEFVDPKNSESMTVNVNWQAKVKK